MVRMGADKRVVLPSCAVAWIRNEFPSGLHTVYQNVSRQKSFAVFVVFWCSAKLFYENISVAIEKRALIATAYGYCEQ